MSKRLQSIRGMHDLLPEQTPIWRDLEAVLIDTAHRYGYEQIRMPIVELTELFARSIGAVTDIVEKEMYTFDDRNGDSLTLRPEGTAGCVRAALEHGLIHNQQRKLYYMARCFATSAHKKGATDSFINLVLRHSVWQTRHWMRNKSSWPHTSGKHWGLKMCD